MRAVEEVTPTAADTAETRSEWDRRFSVLLGTVDTEDFAVAEAIQRGLASGAQTHLTFDATSPRSPLSTARSRAS